MNSEKLVYWFEEIDKAFNDIVGKKCANLGEMMKIGLPVPPGFAISIDMYKRFLVQSGLGERLSKHIRNCGNLQQKSLPEIEEVSRDIRRLIEGCPLPVDLEAEICSCYEELCNRCKRENIAVSVRSAGTESRPGMFETYLNVRGKHDVVDKVKKVWASSFTPRAIAFRIKMDLPIDCDMLGVAAVKMVNARAAGISFTVDPVTGDDSKVIIEGNWGLGEGVVSGMENVDRWSVDKRKLRIVERCLGKKTKYVISRETGTGWAEIPSDKQTKPCLTDDEIRQVAKAAILLEQRLGEPQDMEWAVEPDLPRGRNVLLLQTRAAKSACRKVDIEFREAADKLATMMRTIDLTGAAEKIRSIRFRF